MYSFQIWTQDQERSDTSLTMKYHSLAVPVPYPSAQSPLSFLGLFKTTYFYQALNTAHDVIH